MTNYEYENMITGYSSVYDGKYWNAGLNKDSLSAINWGLTDACHQAEGTNCCCNNYNRNYQCAGFSFFMAYVLTGCRMDAAGDYASDGAVIAGEWVVRKQNLNSITLEPGDIVRTKPDANGKSHSAVIWRVRNSVVEVVECLGSEGCEIHFGYFNGSKIPTYMSDILADAFYVIKAPKGNKTCKISNYGNGKYLNVVGTALNNNQSVTTLASNGTDGQKWYINGYNNGEYIRSAVDADYVLSTGSSNACVLSDNDSSQSNMVDIVIVGENSTGKICIIRKSNDSFICLTSDGTRAYWDTYSSGNNLQKWIFAEL